jgi:hypothetical protein
MPNTPPPLPPTVVERPVIKERAVVVRKSSPLTVLLAFIGVLAILAVGAYGFFFYRTIAGTGAYDADLMRRDPGLAMARMAVAMNPNLALVHYHEGTGMIAMKDRATGKVINFRLDEQSRQLVAAPDATAAAAVASESGAPGSMPDSRALSWVPVYPGSAPQGMFLSQTPEGDSQTFTFQTTDTSAKVNSYYQEHLKSGGFNLTLVAGGERGGIVQGEDPGHKRTITVTVGTSGDGVQASVLAVEKK